MSKKSTKTHDMIMKLLLIGDSGIGKSCLLLRFVEDKFNPTFITTVGIDFKIRTIESNGKKLKLQVWDTAGQERFRTITTAYYRGAMGIVLVYDVTDMRSFENIKSWYKTVTQYANENTQIFLVGNKCDDEENRQVSMGQGEELATELQVPFLEVSAKNNIDVETIFYELAKMIQEKHKDNSTFASNPNNIDFSKKTFKLRPNCC